MISARCRSRRTRNLFCFSASFTADTIGHLGQQAQLGNLRERRRPQDAQLPEVRTERIGAGQRVAIDLNCEDTERRVERKRERFEQ